MCKDFKEMTLEELKKRPLLTIKDNFNELSSEMRINYVLSLSSPIFRMRFKRMLTPEELSIVNRLDTLQIQKREEEERRKRFADCENSINRKIDFYKSVLSRKSFLLAILKKWNGKRVTKNFENDARNALKVDNGRVTVDWSSMVDGIGNVSGKLVVYIEGFDVQASVISGGPTTYKLIGKTARLDGNAVIENCNENFSDLEKKVTELERYRNKISDSINTWNKCIKELEDIRRNMPYEFRDSYGREFHKIYM